MTEMPPGTATSAAAADAAAAHRRAQRRIAAALSALLVLGLSLRLWGITVGLPYAYHVDEYNYAASARDLREGGRSRIDATSGPLHALVLFLYAGFDAVPPLVDRMPLPPAVVAALNWSPMDYLVLARVAMAIVGALTIIPVFLLGRRLWGAPVGLIAAGLFAVCYLPVRNAHFGTPDTLASALLVVAVLVAHTAVRRGSLAGYLGAGAIAGLTVATKQLLWPVFVTFLLFQVHAATAHRPGRRDAARLALRSLFDRRLWLAFVTGLATWAIAMPQVLLDPAAFYRYWQGARAVGALGGMDRMYIEDTGPALSYIYSFWWGLGGALFIGGAAGLIYAASQRRARPLAAFLVLYLAFLITPGHFYFARYALGAIPFLVVGAAALVWTLAGRVTDAPRWRALAAAAITVVLGAEPLVASIRHNRLITQPDTRTVAKQWIEQHVPPSSTVMLEFVQFSPQLASPSVPVPFSTRTYEVLARGAYGLSDFSNFFGPSQGTPTVADYAALGVEYIVSNSFNSSSRLISPDEDRAKRGFYEALDREADLLATISPYREGQTVPRIFEETYGPATHLDRYVRPGPVLKIYRLRPAEHRP